MKPKAIYIASRPFLPVVGGRERMIEQSVRWLAKEYDLTLIVLGRTVAQDVCSYTNIGISNCIFLRLNNVFDVACAYWRNPRLSGQELLYWSARNFKIIQDLIASEQPAFVICDMLRTGQFVQAVQGPKKFLELDDLLSVRYKNFIKDGNYRDAFGTFGSRVPFIIRAIVGFFTRYVLLRESKILARAELDSVNRFDAVFLTSAVEASRLRALTSASNIYSLPPAVKAIPEVARPDNSNLRLNSRLRALFLGNIRTQQNKDSIRYIVNVVLPFLELNSIEIELVVVGVYDHDFLMEISGKHSKNIDFRGFVPDLSLVISECDMALMPIAHGTGICTKILEVMMHGLIVITNDEGARGLDVESGEHLFLANDPEQILSAISLIESDDNRLKKIQLQAKEFVMNSFEEQKIARDYIGCINHYVG